MTQGCGGGSSGTSTPAPAQYTFTDLGRNTTATAINASGIVVGTTPAASFLYSHGTMTLLPSLGQQMKPDAVNSTGQVVGDYYSAGANGAGQTVPFLYSNGTASDLPLPPLERDSEPVAINDQGQIAVNGYGGTYGAVAFLFSGGTYAELPQPAGPGTYTSAMAMNRAGAVAFENASRAYLYEGGKSIYLGIPPGTDASTPTGVNDAGEVVGYGHPVVHADPPGVNVVRPFVWDKAHGIRPLATVPGASDSGQADGINNRGQIVGTVLSPSGEEVVALWQNGTATNVSARIEGRPALLDVRVVGISDGGQICGNYDDSTGSHAFLLTPV